MVELLDVSNLSISFTQYVQGLQQRELKVISDLSLDVNEGEVVAILGSSGSGKSLLAHAILGILPENAACSGDISFKGKVLTEEDKKEIRGKSICLIPQSVNYLDPLMKVSQQAIGKTKDEEDYKHKKSHQREVFLKYGLDESVDNMYPFELSGGMARKVLLSTALLSNPELLVADEPTPGLDDKSVEETINDIKKLAEEGKGVLLITHDIEVAIRTANRIAIFYSGYVIEINQAENFKNADTLMHPYSKALIDSLPDNGFKLTEGTQPLNDNKGCIYYKNCLLRKDICKDTKPSLHKIGDSKVRCHLYNGGLDDET
ncbi:ATP-binding cassette domain-containing protein [Methanobrevibacter olleyae]|uniref:Nickel import system ATP-binding protein NikD n=1 Tax=Methanobrevibacter olleyae TaxID=294671 RepID=A0A126QZV6_METOL|nr:ABC transporter ATP-binding protein [Methanobrevibacter olleyae]AMK15653.1 peptide/nickel ABC transporter ATP-binding protein [Methanobrevibacter olleyae]SFL23836.1 peptide/nickel transport system ATP-binding protein [Methanobrevibacter olleyae]